MRREDLARAGELQNARSADESGAEMRAVKGRKRIFRDWMSPAVDGHAAGAAIADETSDADHVGQLRKQRAVLCRVAPRKHRNGDHWLERGRFVLQAVIPGQIAKLVGINGL